MATVSPQPNEGVSAVHLDAGRRVTLPDAVIVASQATGGTADPSLEQLLSIAAPSQVRLVSCARVRDGLRRIEGFSQQQVGKGRVVACVWDVLPAVSTMIDDIVDRLAQAAQLLWPHWYDEPHVAQDYRFPEDDCRPSRILSAWYREALVECREARPPRLKRFAPAVQAQQLALALSPDRLVLALAVEDESAPPDRLLGLARGAEWLALNTSAAVVVLVPEPLVDSVALDAINFEIVRLAVRESVSSPPIEEKQHVLIGPIHGNPHPNSQGEQLLAAAIRVDDQLCDLFQFNEYVDSITGNRFLVDLLWPAGKVVVEVDGFAWHRDLISFSRDRQRDYELLISGYLTLRLPHHEVVDDVTAAIAKIGQVVAYRCHQPLSRGGS
jgi:very-short-patch-repair endonuclease